MTGVQTCALPILAAEEEVNEADGVTTSDPNEIRAVLYRTDDPNNNDSRRTTSETLWMSFPESAALPQIFLNAGQEGGQG